MVPRVLGVVHRVLGVLRRVLGFVHRVLGVLHGVLGVLHRVLGFVHRVLGVTTRGARGSTQGTRGTTQGTRGTWTGTGCGRRWEPGMGRVRPVRIIRGQVLGQFGVHQRARTGVGGPGTPTDNFSRLGKKNVVGRKKCQPSGLTGRTSQRRTLSRNGGIRRSHAEGPGFESRSDQYLNRRNKTQFLSPNEPETSFSGHNRRRPT